MAVVCLYEIFIHLMCSAVTWYTRCYSGTGVGRWDPEGFGKVSTSVIVGDAAKLEIAGVQYDAALLSCKDAVEK